MAAKKSSYRLKQEAGKVPFKYMYRMTMRRAKELGIRTKGRHLDTIRKIMRERDPEASQC